MNTRQTTVQFRRYLVPLASLVATTLLTSCSTIHGESGFTNLFDGQTLNGWRSVGAPANSYQVEDGAIVCTPAGRNLFTEREFSDFVLRFEFKLEDGSNNGLGIRAPIEGDA